jgi:putative DNA primase/helicase
VKNGVVKLDGNNRQLLDHSPEYRFLHRAGTEFDENADCPTWKAFLEDSIRSGAERDKLQEYVGYALYHWGLPFHKGLFLVGPKASGKSTFLDTVRSLLGEEGIASVTPQQMTERFGGAELFGKWANIRSDIPSEMISNTGEFKEIIAGDAIKAEKKHQDPFMFKPTAKHFYSANTLPDTEDDDDAFYRRILLVAFPTSVPPEQQDKRLPETLKDELPGILNWALDGLQRLLDQRGFTADRDEAKTADTWAKWGSTTDRFASICLDAGGGETIPKGDVYNVYTKFCQEENMPAEPQRVFTRRLKTEHGIQDGKTSVDGRQQRCFMDIAFTHRAEEYQGLDDDRGGMNSGLGNY